MSKSEAGAVEAPATPRQHNTPSVDDRAPEAIDPAHRAAVAAGLADMQACRLASPSEIEDVYARFGRVAR